MEQLKCVKERDGVTIGKTYQGKPALSSGYDGYWVLDDNNIESWHYKDQFTEVSETVSDVKVKVVKGRVEDREDDKFYYEIRHSDRSQQRRSTVEKGVFVNFWGTVISTQPIPEIEQVGCMEFKDFQEKYQQTR